MLHSSYNLFDFAKGESLHINDFPKIDGWSVDQHSVVKVLHSYLDSYIMIPYALLVCKSTYTYICVCVCVCCVHACARVHVRICVYLS